MHFDIIFMTRTALYQANAGYTGSDGWSWYTLFLCFACFFFRFSFRFLRDTQHFTACNDPYAWWYIYMRVLFGFYFGG